MSEARPLWSGYEIVGPLGHGGMGAVYRARHQGLAREVAVKVLPAADAASPDARRRFLAEARALARLSHPHVVQIHDVMEHGDACAFAMELVAGGSLAGLLDAVAAVPPEQRLATAAPALAATDRSWVRFVARVGQQMAQALAAVHAAGLVHRDVKPSNILLRSDGTALLSDFGLVRDLDARSARTVTGQFVGTLAYAAPEQLRAQAGAVDARSDVYALGATLYHALTLIPPVAAAHPSQVLARIEAGVVRPAHLVDRSVPRDLALVVGQAMDPDPARRYQTARALAEDLERVLALRPVLARAPGAGLRLRRACARHPVAGAALGTAVLMLVVSSVLILVGLAAGARRARAPLDRLLAAGLLAEVEELSAGGGARVAALGRWLDQARGLLARAQDGGAWTDPSPQPEALDEAALDRVRAARARVELDGPHPPVNSEMLIHWVQNVAARPPRSADHGGDSLARLRAAEVALARRLAATLAADQVFAAALRERWPQAVQDAADVRRFPKYQGLVLTPQSGLVPLGPDPESGLLEFAHLQTGLPPERDPATGRLRLTEDCGVVLVLLPGGPTQVGCRAPEPGEADGVEYCDSLSPTPVDRVRLAPFLIARTELTQAQWLRVTGRNPSWFAAGARVGEVQVTGLHPVESVLHEDAEQVLDRLELVLPTLAQWEYAARGGTATRYWTGPDAGSLRGAENVRDLGYLRRRGATAGMQGSEPAAPWDDGWPIHAPVASLRANPFGLHDTLGNVQELCRELSVLSRHRPVPRDGEGELDRTTPGSWQPVTRGGAWNLGLFEARVAFKIGRPPGFRFPGVGLRPARALWVRR